MNRIPSLSIQELGISHNLSTYTVTVCLNNGLTSLDKILEYYSIHQSFLALKSCGYKTGEQLLNLCRHYTGETSVPIPNPPTTEPPPAKRNTDLNTFLRRKKFSSAASEEETTTVNRTSRKKMYQYIQDILRQKGRPMHVRDITAKMKKTEAYSTTDMLKVRERIQKKLKLFVRVSPNVYGLKEWEQQIRPFPGHVNHLIIFYLDIFGEPKPFRDIANYILKHRMTDETTVLSHLNSRVIKDIVHLPDRHYVLKAWKDRTAGGNPEQVYPGLPGVVRKVYFGAQRFDLTFEDLLKDIAWRFDLEEDKVRRRLEEAIREGAFCIRAERLALPDPA